MANEITKIFVVSIFDTHTNKNNIVKCQIDAGESVLDNLENIFATFSSRKEMAFIKNILSVCETTEKAINELKEVGFIFSDRIFIDEIEK